MNGRARGAVWAILILATWTAHAAAQRSTSRASGAAPGSGSAVATVGGVPITRAEFEARFEQAFTDLRSRVNQTIGAETRDAMRRQVLESLIRRQLLMLEARRTGVTVADADVEAVLKRDPIFSTNGRFDPTRWETVRTQQPANFKAAFAAVHEQLAGRALSERLERESGGDRDAVRREARQALTTATVDLFTLETRSFGEPAREPREADIVNEYRTHPERYRRPERAELSFAFVNLPPLGDADRVNPAAARAWSDRMRARADTMLALSRAGEDISALIDSLGGLRRVTVSAGRFPNYWLGSQDDEQAIRRAGSGQWLPTPVRATEGWLLVKVERHTPAGTAPLRDVAGEIRTSLRTYRREHADEVALRSLFETVRDSLHGPGLQVSYAWTDTSAIDIGQASDSDLERFYRAHQADYSSFDARSGRIVVRPLSDVRDEIASRWTSEEKMRRARHGIEAVERAWRAGKRDRRAESAVQVREPAPVPLGGTIDSGLVAAAVSESLWNRPVPLAVNQRTWARGIALWRVEREVASVAPSYGQVEDALRKVLERRRGEEDERGARALYEADPARFVNSTEQTFSYIFIPLPEPETITLTHSDVEKWWRDHIDRYSAPEMVNARHILISPTAPGPAADEDARKRAQAVADRLRAGEPFFELAQKYTDDAPTRNLGGDLGRFGRGVMLEPFERAAFSLEPGVISQPVRSDAGYHIIEVTDHLPAFVHPLAIVYTNAGWDCAVDRSIQVAAQRADSVLRLVRNPEQARELAAALGLEVVTRWRTVGESPQFASYGPLYEQLDGATPGEILRRPFYAQDQGYWIPWVNSTGAATPRSWPESREDALARYRQSAGERGLVAKLTECDSLLRAGWSLDSLASLWGGWSRVESYRSGFGLRTPPLAAAVLDSVVFGAASGSPALAAGGASGWLRNPSSVVRLRVVARTAPSESEVVADVERRQREQIQRRMGERFEGYRRRHPVVIRDAKLRATPLPGAPPG